MYSVDGGAKRIISSINHVPDCMCTLLHAPGTLLDDKGTSSNELNASSPECC